MPNFITKLKNAEDGTTAIEYALLVGLVFLAIVGSVQFLGSQISSSLYDKVVRLL
jgi:Flp pilus assembly pilin Flp